MDRYVLNRLQRGIDLLTVNNPKLEKSVAKGYATAGVSLAPAWESGHNTCPNHSTECSKDCLLSSNLR